MFSDLLYHQFNNNSTSNGAAGGNANEDALQQSFLLIGQPLQQQQQSQQQFPFHHPLIPQRQQHQQQALPMTFRSLVEDIPTENTFPLLEEDLLAHHFYTTSTVPPVNTTVPVLFQPQQQEHPLTTQPKQEIPALPEFNFSNIQQNFISILNSKKEEQKKEEVKQKQKTSSALKKVNATSNNSSVKKRSTEEVESDQTELKKLLAIPEKERTEEQKKSILKLRNRETAKRSRDRKKIEFESTIEENRKLLLVNKQLLNELNQLKSENLALRKTIEQLSSGKRDDSPDSYALMPKDSDASSEHESDLENNMYYDEVIDDPYIPITSLDESLRSSPTFSPLFNYANNETDTGSRKRSRLFVLVFFVACACCFFFGTTLMTELPSNTLFIKNNPSERKEEIRLMDTPVMQRASSYISHTSPSKEQETSAKSKSDSASISLSVRDQAFQSTSDISTSELLSKSFETTASVQKLTQSEREEPISKMNSNANADLLPLTVELEPDVNKFIVNQLKLSTDVIPAIIRLDVGNKQSAYIFTSISKSMNKKQRLQYLSKYKTTLWEDIQRTCLRKSPLLASGNL